MQNEERVILLDEAGRATGTAAKAEVHHAATPLHLAFSCYVFDTAGRVLVTRRAPGKRTFPGVWTNSVCGHPGPGEPLDGAVRRRARQELGLTLDDLRLVLPSFRYRAVQDGVVENEMCPVFTAVAVEPAAAPDPTEVDRSGWVGWEAFAGGVRAGRWPGVSPWCAEQVAALAALGGPSGWAGADPQLLPPAARVTCREQQVTNGRSRNPS